MFGLAPIFGFCPPGAGLFVEGVESGKERERESCKVSLRCSAN